MPMYKLTYMNGRARAETIRFIFLQSGVDFEDVRISEEEWPTVKAKFPYFQVPILEEDGKVLAQSDAITMYLAKKFGLAGENDWEEAKIHELVGLGNDMMTYSIPYFEENDECRKKQMMAILKEDRLIPIYKRLEEMLAKSGSGYFVGKKMTAADLEVFQFLDWYTYDFPDLLKNFQHLSEFVEKIGALPAIKKWLEIRPVTVY